MTPKSTDAPVRSPVDDVISEADEALAAGAQEISEQEVEVLMQKIGAVRETAEGELRKGERLRPILLEKGTLDQVEEHDKQMERQRRVIAVLLARRGRLQELATAAKKHAAKFKTPALMEDLMKATQQLEHAYAVVEARKNQVASIAAEVQSACFTLDRVERHVVRFDPELLERVNRAAPGVLLVYADQIEWDDPTAPPVRLVGGGLAYHPNLPPELKLFYEHRDRAPAGVTVTGPGRPVPKHTHDD